MKTLVLLAALAIPSFASGATTVPGSLENADYIRFEAGPHAVVCAIPGKTKFRYVSIEYEGKRMLVISPTEVSDCLYLDFTTKGLRELLRTSAPKTPSAPVPPGLSR